MSEEDIASKCYDIHVSLAGKEVPEFEFIPKVGMMVSLSLHLRGLPILEYEKLRLVSSYYFRISPLLLKDLLESLEEIEFVKLITKGSSIHKIQPQIPFFESVYEKVGEFANNKLSLNEPEELALEIISKLTSAPTEQSNLYSLGAEKKLVDRNLVIGHEGGYILTKRARGKNILLSPLFFSENADVFADLTARAGSTKIKRILELVKSAQGLPLSIIESTMRINENSISIDDLNILKRLAADGAVRPPSIKTTHSGENFFIFSPSPGNSKLNPAKREIYERAMAIVASVRQGQFLAKQFRIYSPVALLKALKRNGYLKSTSETFEQYHQLAVIKVGKMVKVSGDRYQFHLVSSEENTAALDLAISLIDTGNIVNMEINDNAILALQKDQTYIESIISSNNLRTHATIALDEETMQEFDNILLTGLGK
ncbi:hypothetical protein [Dyadobacter pollutisoli]|uniref:Uncharacterized protein n=1 Tax=Dyadobacter pollutisoli TaxID=2910158 RepID=A0A9E8N9K9_9BACT|nr:hypothetical protein [Dyadobacter pollutisoli]WAC12410.1 hypothetical protein ON006_00315 [Dyadobacter pollutisoli]